MSSNKVGKIPPFELVPMLYRKFGTSTFTRRMVETAYGRNAYVSVLRALKDGWLRKIRKTDDGVYEYALSGKAMHHVERFVNERGRASC